MKNFKLIGLFLLFNLGHAQEIFKNENLGFSIEHPQKWIIAKKGQALENTKEFVKLDPSDLKKLIQENKGSVEVVAFYKYPIEGRAGVIPTIKVDLRNNPYTTFDAFKKSIIGSFKSIKDVFPDFRFLEEPSVIEIDGKKCVFASCAYTLTANSGSEKVSVFVYAIPVNGNFYQMTFIDSEKENNIALFKGIVKTISIK